MHDVPRLWWAKILGNLKITYLLDFCKFFLCFFLQPSQAHLRKKGAFFLNFIEFFIFCLEFLLLWKWELRLRTYRNYSTLGLFLSLEVKIVYGIDQFIVLNVYDDFHLEGTIIMARKIKRIRYVFNIFLKCLILSQFKQRFFLKNI